MKNRFYSVVLLVLALVLVGFAPNANAQVTLAANTAYSAIDMTGETVINLATFTLTIDALTSGTGAVAISGVTVVANGAGGAITTTTAATIAALTVTNSMTLTNTAALTVTAATTIPTTIILSVAGDMTFTGGLTIAGVGAGELNITTASTITGTITTDGGGNNALIDVDASSTIGDLTLADNIEVQVAPTFTLSTGVIAVGTDAIDFTQTGTVTSTSAATVTTGTFTFTESMTFGSDVTVGGAATLSVATGKTATLNGDWTVGTNSLKLFSGGAGITTGTGAFSFTETTGENIISAGVTTSFALGNDITLVGTVAATDSIGVSGLTADGGPITLGAAGKTISTTTYPVRLSIGEAANAGAVDIRLAGSISLAETANLTIQTAGYAQVAFLASGFAAVTNLSATGSGATFDFDPDGGATTLVLPAAFTFGTTGGGLLSLVNTAATIYSITTNAIIGGPVALGLNATLSADTNADILQIAASDSLVILTTAATTAITAATTGVLDIDGTLVISKAAALTPTGNMTVALDAAGIISTTVAGDITNAAWLLTGLAGTINFDGAATMNLGVRSLGANTLTLTHSGTGAHGLITTAFTLDTATSILRINGGGTGTMTIADLRFVGNAAAKLSLNSDLTVTSMTNTDGGIISWDASSTLTMGSNIVVPDAKILQLNGLGGGSLTPAAAQKITAIGATNGASASTLRVGGFGLDIGMGIDIGNINGDLVADTPLLDVNESVDISGAIVMVDEAAIDIATGKTLTYKNTANIDVSGTTAATLFLPGAGTFADDKVLGAGSIELGAGNAASLNFTGTGKVNKVIGSSTGGIILATADATVDSITFPVRALGVTAKAAANKTLTVNNWGYINGGTITLDATGGYGAIAGGTITLGQDVGAAVFADTDALVLTGTATMILNSDVNVVDDTTSVTMSSTNGVYMQGDYTFATSTTLNIATGNTLYYGGADISIASGDSLVLSGAGTISGTIEGLQLAAVANTAAVKTVTDSLSAVVMSGGYLDFQADATIDSMNISSDAAVIETATAQPTVTTLTAPDGFHLKSILTGAGFVANSQIDLTTGVLSLDGTTSLNLAGTGNITITGASAGVTIANTSGSTTLTKGLVLASDGTFTVSNSVSLNADITLNGDATFNIATGKTFSYGRPSLTLVAGQTLTLKGGGTFSNTNALILSTATSGFTFGAGGGTISKLTINANDAPLTMNNAAPSTITTLAYDAAVHEKTLTFSSTDDSLTVTGGLTTLAAEDTLTITGTGGNLMTALTASNTRNRIVFDSPGFKLRAALTIGNGTANKQDSLVVTENATITGVIDIVEDATFDIASGKTLAHSGASFDVDAFNLTMAGGGTFANENTVDLNHASSKLHFLGSSVDSVEVSIDGATIEVNADATISGLVLTAASTIVNYNVSGKTLTVDGKFAIPAAKTFSLKPSLTTSITSATFAGDDTVEVGSSSIINTVDGLTLSKAVELGTGTLNADSSMTLSGKLVLNASGSVDVATAQTVTYTGGTTSLGSYTLSVAGVGTFSNSSANAISLDSTTSVVAYAVAGSLGTVAYNKTGSKLDFNAAGVLGDIEVTSGDVTIDFGANNAVVNGDFTVGATDTLLITGAGAGSLNGTGVGTASYLRNSATASPVILKNMTMTAGGIIDVPQDFSVDSLTAAGNLFIVNTDAFSVGGKLVTSAAATISEDSTAAVTIGGAIDAGGDLSFVSGGPLSATPNDWVFTGVDSIISSATSVVSFDSSVTFSDASFALGRNGNSISITSPTAIRMFVVNGAGAMVRGTAVHTGDDTLRFSGTTFSVAEGGILKSTTTGTYVNVELQDQAGALNGTLHANGGLLDVTAAAGVWTSAITGADSEKYAKAFLAGSKADFVADSTGTLRLPSGWYVDMDDGNTTNSAGINVEGSAMLTATVADSIFMFVNDADNRTFITLTGGTAQYIGFAVSVNGTSTNLNNFRYVTAVFVSPWVDGPGTGTPEDPYSSLATALSIASAGETSGQVRLAAGTYAVDAQIVLNNVSIKGAQNQDFVNDFSGTITDSWGAGPGATVKVPVLNFADALTGTAILVETDNVDITGLRFNMGDGITNAIEVVKTAGVGGDSANVTGLDVSYSEFNMKAAQNVLASDAATGFGATFQNNKVDGSGDYTLVLIDQPDSTANVTVQNNTITNGRSYVHVGGGNIDDITFDANTHINGGGLQVGRIGASVETGGTLNEITVTNSTFKGDIDFAFAIAGVTATTDFVGDVNDSVDVNDNHFYGMFDAVSSTITDVVASTDEEIDAEGNWWGSYEGPNQTGGATATGTVDYSPWDLVPTLTGTDLVVTGVGTAKEGTAIMVTVYSATAREVVFSTNFAADMPVGVQTVEANIPDAYAKQTFAITPLEGKTGAWIKVSDDDNSSADYATTNMFDVTALSATDIAAVASFDASDMPGDLGGYVLLQFPASANHPGYGDAAGDLLPIDYYQVYANAADDFSTALAAGFIVATPKVDGQGDTVRVSMSTNGQTSTLYYWIAAVRGDLPSPVAPAAKVDGVQRATLNPVVDLEVQASVVGADRISSALVGPDKALAFDNSKGVGDYDPIEGIGLGDLAIFADFFGIADEYEIAFDLDGNGEVGLGDFIIFASMWTEDAQAKDLNTGGMNVESRFEMTTTFDFASEYLSVDVTGRDLSSMGGYAFTFKYDPEVFEFVGVDKGEFLESNNGRTPLFLEKNSEGRVTVANVISGLTKDNAVNGEGIVATMTFRWIGDKNSAITLDGISVLDHNAKLNALEKNVVENPVPLPTEFKLNSNYPNPFNPTTTISFDLPESENVRIDIYNVLGQRVKTLVNRQFKAGTRQMVWDARNNYGVRVASGMYIYKIVTGNNVATKKMMLLK